MVFLLDYNVKLSSKIKFKSLNFEGKNCIFMPLMVKTYRHESDLQLIKNIFIKLWAFFVIMNFSQLTFHILDRQLAIRAIYTTE